MQVKRVRIRVNVKRRFINFIKRAPMYIPSQVLYGADMALRDNDGYTPLHLAAREGHVDAFKEMLRKGTENFVLVNKFEGDTHNSACIQIAK